MNNGGEGRGKRTWRGGGGGRGFPGRFQNRWSYKKRGNGAGRSGDGERAETSAGGNDNDSVDGRGGFRGRGRRGYGYRQSNTRNGEDDNGGEAPPPKRKRVDPMQTIKTNVINQWRKLLPGYDLYYCDNVPQLSEFERKVSAVEAFLTRIGFAEELCEAEREDGTESYYLMRFDEIVKEDELHRSWQEFRTDLSDEPEETITLWSATAHKVIYNRMLQLQADEDSYPGRSPPTPPKIQIGFSKLDAITALKDLKSGLLGKFVTIKGAIVRTGNIRPYCRRLTFRCKICESEFAIEQNDGNYTPPVICKSEECKNNNTYFFEVKESAPTTVVVDSRRIRVQDILHCNIEAGRVPRTIDCVLFGELAEHCSTGDAVTISGIVKMCRDNTRAGEQSLHHQFIEVSSVTQHKDSERTMGGHLLNFTNKDYYAVQEIHDTPDLFRLLIASLCPAIYGHELVKAGLLLCLFGGTPMNDGLVTRRSDINMLMVGDPGIGKSQMLKVLTDVAPKAVYVCGTGSTVAGLTVTLVKDGDDYSLEAGALVMADRGVCCIDEFDKMSAQHHALLEALEQQSVSVAKSGVYRTLPARTTVIAAANPVGGHYDTCKTVSENIKINPALMSRFDLIFILLDRPDEEFDQRLIEHVMGVRKVVNTSTSASGKSMKVGSGVVADADESEENNNLLINRVKIRPGEVFDLIPHVLLRKYIAYAKQYVQPKLCPEASEVLKKYYLNMRLSHRSVDSTPVTARQLESLIRLTEARAKLELREVATVQDANDILEIFDFSLSSVFDDEVHAVSALSKSVLLESSISSGTGRAKSTASQAKRLVKALQDLAHKQCKNIFSEDEIKGLAAALGFKDKSDVLIGTLNNEGFLLKKPGKTYQLQTADY